jgi:hypothetical protein
MSTKILAAVAFSLALGTAAFAQSGGTSTNVGGSPATSSGDSAVNDQQRVFPKFTGAIGDAFYSDMDKGTLRTEAEMRANFGNLTAEQQAQVRTDCNRVTQSESGTDKMQTSGTGTAGTTTGTGSNFATAAAPSELCNMVSTF